MAKINILPAKVYNRIAAGEVVERPYSVLKELVENSIDAGATEIEIYVENGGKQLIRVVDNGCGIEREDLHSAFLPHATSKISQAEDLENILTLGFRGEAVASIASVSQMTITSKTETGKCYQLSSSGGEIGQIKEVSGEKGTDVKVEMLFFNAPVRLKFLKSDKAEETDITNFVSKFILNRSDIAFTYYVNGKKVLQSFGGGDEEAFVSVYGAQTLSNCYQINANKHGIKIRGYIGNANFYKANKSYQNVFLNGRYIVNTTISASVSNAYASYLMKRQYPFYLLHIEVPTEIVDVNVNPNKTDVRFADNQIIYGCIYNVISAVLDGHSKALEYVVSKPKLAPFGFEEKEEIAKTENFPIKTEVKAETKPEEIKEEKLAVSTEIKEEKRFAEKVFDEVSGNEKTGSAPKMFGFETLTYEQAKKEIDAYKPNYAKGVKENSKGFTPIAEIPPFVPLEKPIKPIGKVEEYGVEKLHEKYPDLYFKRNVLELNDPNYKKEEKQAEEDPFLANKRYLEELDKKNSQVRIDVVDCKYAGKLFNTYLLYERKDEVYIIDQHAAHERLIFNSLKEKMQNRTIVQQPMLAPYQITLNAFESEFLRERLDDIREMGFAIEEREEMVFEVSAIPLDLQNINLKTFFHEILGDVNGYRSIQLTDILKDKLASTACKSAIKGGMDLTESEIQALFLLIDGNMGLKCPHGRPVVVKMTKTELEKMFKRIV